MTRNSVNQKVTDFSALVSKIGDEIDVVYLPWQIAANGQIFGQQMKEQGKKAVIFGSDGLDSGDFKIQGAYISAFAPSDFAPIVSFYAFVIVLLSGTGRMWAIPIGALIFSFVFAYLIGLVIEKTIGFRIKNEDEIAGIDTVIHGEEGYLLAESKA